MMTHKDFLFKVLEILEKNDIEYCLFAGTLLGAIREKNFLSGDNKDTDIAIDDKDYWKVRYLFDKHILRKEFEWYSILRKEVSVIDESHSFKVDVFFMEAESENYLVYSYKPNKHDNKWNHEWRAIFPKEAFFPAKKIDFLGRKVYVPKNYELVLKTEYGDWKTPKPNWVSNDKTVLNNDNFYEGFYPAGINLRDYAIDENNYDIGFICVNFFRNEETKTCVESLQKHYSNIKIYLADQNAPTGEMIEFYESHHVEYYFMPFDCGLSVCRNFLVEKVKESRLMWGDNDFVFDTTSNISHALKILNEKEDIGFVGGAVKSGGNTLHYERILSYVKEYNLLLYVPLELTNPEPQNIDDIYFYYCDLTFNFVICKTNVVQDNKLLRWNEALKVSYEHSDLFLRLKLYCDYRVVYCPSMIVNHVHLTNNTMYNQYRIRRDASTIFAKSWNLRLNFTIGQGREFYAPSEITQEKYFKISKGLSVPYDNNKITEQVALFKFIIETLKNNNIDFWFIEESCLEIIKSDRLLTFPIHIGIKNEFIKQDIKKLLGDYEKNILYRIEYNRHTKSSSAFGIEVKVPFPVVDYLVRLYGERWDK